MFRCHCVFFCRFALGHVLADHVVASIYARTGSSNSSISTPCDHRELTRMPKNASTSLNRRNQFICMDTFIAFSMSKFRSWSCDTDLFCSNMMNITCSLRWLRSSLDWPTPSPLYGGPLNWMMTHRWLIAGDSFSTNCRPSEFFEHILRHHRSRHHARYNDHRLIVIRNIIVNAEGMTWNWLKAKHRNDIDRSIIYIS